jgi:hypothetical protein
MDRLKTAMRQKSNYYQLYQKFVNATIAPGARLKIALLAKFSPSSLLCLSQILALKHSVHCRSCSSHY